jgi:hypothetical protein
MAFLAVAGEAGRDAFRERIREQRLISCKKKRCRCEDAAGKN